MTPVRKITQKAEHYWVVKEKKRINIFNFFSFSFWHTVYTAPTFQACRNFVKDRSRI